jgi:hypothetical protein
MLLFLIFLKNYITTVCFSKIYHNTKFLCSTLHTDSVIQECCSFLTRSHGHHIGVVDNYQYVGGQEGHASYRTHCLKLGICNIAVCDWIMLRDMHKSIIRLKQNSGSIMSLLAKKLLQLVI